MKKTAASALLGFAATLASTAALAYLPPSSFVLKSLAQKHTSVAGIQVKSKVTVYESGKATATQFKVLTVFNSRDGRMLSAASDAQDRKLYVAEKKMPNLAPGAAVLLSPHHRALAQLLIANGVPVVEGETVAAPSHDHPAGSDEGPAVPEHLGGTAEGMVLSRWRDAIAWVIGPAQGSQLWVEKDTFLPLRLILSAAGQPQLEVRYDNTRFFKEFPYPKTIGLLKAGATILQDEALEVTPFPESRGLKTPVLPGLKVGATGFTDEGNSAPSELREAIQQYYEHIR